MTLPIWWPRSRWKRTHVFTTLSNEDLTNRQIHGLKGLIVNVPGGFVSSIGKPDRLTTTGSGNTVASNVQVAPLTPPSPTDGFAKCTPSYALKSVGNTSVEMFGMIGTVLFDKRPLKKFGNPNDWFVMPMNVTSRKKSFLRCTSSMPMMFLGGLDWKCVTYF